MVSGTSYSSDTIQSIYFCLCPVTDSSTLVLFCLFRPFVYFLWCEILPSFFSYTVSLIDFSKAFKLTVSPPPHPTPYLWYLTRTSCADSSSYTHTLTHSLVFMNCEVSLILLLTLSLNQSYF